MKAGFASLYIAIVRIGLADLKLKIAASPVGVKAFISYFAQVIPLCRVVAGVQKTTE